MIDTRRKDIADAAKEAVQKLERLVNCFDDDVVAEEFTNAVRCMHRTLQQNLMRVIVAQIKSWSETQNFDLRNEATINLCKKITKAVDNDAFLPFI